MPRQSTECIIVRHFPLPCIPKTEGQRHDVVEDIGDIVGTIYNLVMIQVQDALQ